MIYTTIIHTDLCQLEMKREKLVERVNEENGEETQTVDAIQWDFFSMDREFNRSEDFWIKVKGQVTFII